MFVNGCLLMFMHARVSMRSYRCLFGLFFICYHELSKISIFRKLKKIIIIECRVIFSILA